MAGIGRAQVHVTLWGAGLSVAAARTLTPPPPIDHVPREVSLGAMASFSQPQPKFDVNTGERL